MLNLEKLTPVVDASVLALHIPNGNGFLAGMIVLARLSMNFPHTNLLLYIRVLVDPQLLELTPNPLIISSVLIRRSLAGLKVTFNYSSTDYVLDYYDFQPHPTPSSTSVKTKTSTNTSRFVTSPTTKSTSKSSSLPTSKSSSKSTSKLKFHLSYDLKAK